MAGVGTGSVIGSASSITFKPDGSYSMSAIGGFSVSVDRSSVGASSSSAESGTYELNQYTLTLQSNDGKTVKRTVFPYEPDRIYFEGGMMKREK
ncbi:MAG: hypothetical protein L0Z50_42210 [Verrucomicrobiales bacterium]|nr:hypothetical protein [Verrucomicrobiales bacterium]